MQGSDPKLPNVNETRWVTNSCLLPLFECTMQQLAGENLVMPCPISYSIGCLGKCTRRGRQQGESCEMPQLATCTGMRCPTLLLRFSGRRSSCTSWCSLPSATWTLTSCCRQRARSPEVRSRSHRAHHETVLTHEGMALRALKPFDPIWALKGANTWDYLGTLELPRGPWEKLRLFDLLRISKSS